MLNFLAQKVAFTQAANSKGKSLSPLLAERMCFCIKVPRYERSRSMYTHFLRLVWFMIKYRQAVLLIYTVEAINDSPAVQ